MAAGELSAASRTRKSGTLNGGSSSRPSNARPVPPKRAHTSATSTASLRTLTKHAAAAVAAANGDMNSANVAVNGAKSPLLSPLPKSKTPLTMMGKTPSPNYFGLKVDDDASNPPDSDAGKHAKRNWGAYSEEEDGDVPIEDDPKFASFRKQSEQPNHFKLEHSGLSRFSTDGRVPTMKSLAAAAQRSRHSISESDGETGPLSAGGRIQHSPSAEQRHEMEVDGSPPKRPNIGVVSMNASSYFGNATHNSPQQALPARPEMLRNPLSSLGSKHGSLPQSRVTTPHESAQRKPRAETLPMQSEEDGPQLLPADELQSLLKSKGMERVLILDLRVSPQYSQARVKGALNLCIPSTLLKRPAYDLQKLAETFTSPEDKAKFDRWKKADCIVAYDASSIQIRDAQSSVITLKKFRNEGYKGDCCILRGGFNTVSKVKPALVERSAGGGAGPGRLNLSLGSNGSAAGPQAMPVAGGCPMPDSKDQPANPFFGNIRQNMDLIGGVGQIPIKRPTELTSTNLRGLPSWLRDVVDEEEEGKLASERFLEIEKTEQKRMQKAYSSQVQYGGPASRNKIVSEAKQGNVQIAGIEKGTKNRYKDILPYEHARVRLRHLDSDGCDYINASHVKARWSNRRYIACQAPVPTTFRDFWRLVWEQDVRVLVVLTAQSENGQRKCHPYWEPNTYGQYKVKSLSEKKVSLGRPSRASLLDPNRKVSMPLSAMMASKEQSSRMQRRATLMGEGDAQASNNGSDAPAKEPSFCIVRKLALSDVQLPFVPLREVVQVEYTSWPDFGTPAEPDELLSLVEQVNNVVLSSNNAGKSRRDGDGVASPTLPDGFARFEDDESKWPAAPSERPIVVHCSAGCGRTGTFVTVDAVVDMLKRQRLVASRARSIGRGAAGSNVKVPAGAGSGGTSEPNPFESAAATISASSLTDTIVSPTSRMELDSTKQVESPRRRSNRGNLDVAMRTNDSESEDDEEDDDDEDDDHSDTGEADDGLYEDADEDLNSQDWVTRDDIDLVQKTVEDLRTQRLSMVQNLRQYTLCYESVIEWLVREMPERFRRDHFRKSYQG